MGSGHSVKGPAPPPSIFTATVSSSTGKPVLDYENEATKAVDASDVSTLDFAKSELLEYAAALPELQPGLLEVAKAEIARARLILRDSAIGVPKGVETEEEELLELAEEMRDQVQALIDGEVIMDVNAPAGPIGEQIRIEDFREQVRLSVKKCDYEAAGTAMTQVQQLSTGDGSEREIARLRKCRSLNTRLKELEREVRAELEIVVKQATDPRIAGGSRSGVVRVAGVRDQPDYSEGNASQSKIAWTKEEKIALAQALKALPEDAPQFSGKVGSVGWNRRWEDIAVRVVAAGDGDEDASNDKGPRECRERYADVMKRRKVAVGGEKLVVVVKSCKHANNHNTWENMKNVLP